MNAQILREPNKGDRITAAWARELVRAIRSMRLFAGPGIRLIKTPNGTTVTAKSSRPTEYEDAFDVEVMTVSHADTAGIIHGSLPDGTNVAISALEIAMLENITGARVLVHFTQTEIQDGD